MLAGKNFFKNLPFFPEVCLSVERMFTLPVDFPYDLAGSLEIIRHSPSYILEDLSHPGIYRRILTVRGETAVVTVGQERSPGEKNGGNLEIALRFPETSPEDSSRGVPGSQERAGLERLFLDRITRIFSLNHSSRGFQDVFGSDPVLGREMGSFEAVRPIGFGSIFEAFLWAIFEQQVSAASARSLKVRFLESFGERVPVMENPGAPESEGFLWRFPDPWRMAGVREIDLGRMGVSRQKSSYIVALVDRVLSGSLDLCALETSSGEGTGEEWIERLTALRGIGRWSAEYVLMRGLLRPDILCASDLALRTILARHYGGDSPLSVPEVRRIAENWRGFEGWINHLWWHLGRKIGR